jgi:hypothetical protein
MGLVAQTGFDSHNPCAYRLPPQTQYLVSKKKLVHNKLCLIINKTKELHGRSDDQRASRSL